MTLVTKLPSRKATLNNFKRIFDAISQTDLERAKLWYPNAHQNIQDLGERFGKTTPVVAGMVARLSPSIRWDRNLIAATSLLQGKEIVDGYTRNKEVAKQIRDGKWGDTDCSVSFSFPRTSPKIFCFYHNLLHPYTSTHITIDRWMIRTAFNLEEARKLETEVKVSRTVYAELQQRIIDFALDNDIAPVAMQAALWMQIRDIWAANNAITA